MNFLNLTNPGELATYQDTLKFMQDAANAQFSGIIAAIADNAIVSGCVQDGNGNISAGWVIINGELLPFAGGMQFANFDVQQTTTNEQFNDGGMKPVYNVRVAIMTATASSTSVPFSLFKTIKTLKQLAGVITNYTNDYTNTDANTVPTMAAIAALLASMQNSTPSFPVGGIIMWSGTVSAIPAGWRLCNGQNGTPNLTDKFVVGAGNTYGVGNTGGEATHTLTISELPVHDHVMHGKGTMVNGALNLYLSNTATNDNTNNYARRYSGAGSDTLGGKTTPDTNVRTGDTGTGAAHNNLPPYYALCFIMFAPTP